MDNLRNRLNREYWDKSNFITKGLIVFLSFIMLLFMPLYGLYKKGINTIQKLNENN